MNAPVRRSEPPASERCNTFATPVAIDINGRNPRVDWRSEGLLVPWKVSGHADLWVPVDGTAKLFAHFVEHGPQPDMITNTSNRVGYVVVVSGNRDVGKTTLIHKCIDDLAQRLDAVNGGRHASQERGEPRWTLRDDLPGVRIVALSGLENRHGAIGRNSGAPATVEMVNRRILNHVIRELGKHTAFREEAGNRLAPMTDIFEAYEELSDVLVSLNWTLLVIVPDMDWRDDGTVTQAFYRSCSDNARTGIVFFVESSGLQAKDDLRVAFTDLEKTHLVHLEVADPSVEDWSRYICARLRVRDIPGAHVGVADEVIDTTPEPWMYQSVRELQRSLDLIAQEAHRNREEVISMHRLRRFLETRQPVDVRDFRASSPEGGTPQ